jgi:hypothetical protein
MKPVEDVIDFCDADEVRVDGISVVYRVSANTLCMEFCATRSGGNAAFV